MALPRARIDLDLKEELSVQRQNALKSLPTGRLRRMQSYQALLAVHRPATRPSNLHSKLRSVQLELQTRRNSLASEVDIDRLVADDELELYI
mmetsp:Transcript_22875/g.58324  ORF Transcript_22875/g.58324 Transcript_22875/m.58324 type:complete len:92 (+) Transcript_22875:1937-2212(+)